MTTATPQKTVSTINLSELPERTRFNIVFSFEPVRVFEDNTARVSSDHSLFIDGYTIGAKLEIGNRITISAKTTVSRSDRHLSTIIDRATIDNVLSIGDRVLLKQQNVTTELYVTHIVVVEPEPPRSIDLYSLPAGSVVMVRSASKELAIFITGDPAFQPYKGAQLTMLAFTASFPPEVGAPAYRVPVQQFVTEGERFDRMTKVLNAYVVNNED